MARKIRYSIGKKGMGTPDYLLDVVISAIFIGAILLFLSLFFWSGNADIEQEIAEMKSNAADKQHLLTILRTPVEIESVGTDSHETVTFSDGSLSKVIALDGSIKDIYFSEIDPEKVTSAKFSFADGEWAGIAVIDGSTDNIFDKLLEEDIYPSLIRWEDLSSDHDVVFAGCNSPEPDDIARIKAWVSNGGMLITSDRSIRILEKIFSKEMPLIYKEESITTDNIRIEFSSSARQKLGLRGRERIASSYWNVYLQEPQAEAGAFSTVVPDKLAEFTSLEDERCLLSEEGCGAPLWHFDYGTGQVLHFTGHFDENIPGMFDEDFFEILLSLRRKQPKDIELFFGEVDQPVVERQGTFSEMHNAYFFSYIGPYMDIKCPGTSCDFRIGVKGSGGDLIIYPPKVELAVRESIYAEDQMPLADYIIKMYAEDKLSKASRLIKEELNGEDGFFKTRAISITLMPEDKVLDNIYPVDGFPVFSDVTVLAEAELQLPTPGRWLNIKYVEIT